MPKSQPSAAHCLSPDDVEAAFYEALQTGDIEKLMACWADDEEIVCVHPGGPRLLGAGQIRSSFEAMFANGTIGAWPERVHAVQSLTACIHSLVERLDILTAEGPAQAYVIATNVYYQGPQGWRMVVHHASPGTAMEAQPSVSAVLH